MTTSNPSVDYREKIDCIIADPEEFEQMMVDEATGVEYYRRKEAPPEILDPSNALNQGRHETSLLRHYERKASPADFEQLVRRQKEAYYTTLKRSHSLKMVGAIPTTPTKDSRDLSISAAELGATISLFFGGLLAASSISGASLVAPLVGWIGVVFGVGFYAMGRTRRPNA